MEQFLSLLAESKIQVENLCELEPGLWTCFLRSWEPQNKDFPHYQWGTGRGGSALEALLKAKADFDNPQPRAFVPLLQLPKSSISLEELGLDDLQF